MRYRAWVSTATALLLSTTLQAPVYGQSSMVAAPAVTGSTTVPVLNNAAQVALQKAISGNQRIEPARDRARNPAATLQFFGVRPTDTVIEIWPGQGWYTSILGPYLKQGSGSLIIGHFDASSTNSAVVRQIVDAYRARFASDQATYGSVNVVPFGPRSGPLGMPGSADSVLTFRNIHNWMAQGWAEKAFGDFFMVLKPGGILGIEEHRGRTDEPQDPLARDGYVREDFVIQLAREAGFEFIGRSEINANPADTKDHPFGVWTLPPVSRTSALGQRDDPGFDRTRYDAIGESDRMTLRFRKPLNATGAPPSPGTRWSPVIVAPAAPSVVRPAIQAARPTTIVSAGTSPALIVPPPQTARSVTMTTPQVGRTTTLPRGTDLARAREAAAPRLIEPAPLVVPARVKPPVMIAPPVIAPPTPPSSPPPPPPPPAAVASPMTENPAPSSSIAAPLAPSPAITLDETPASSPMPALTARAIETKPLEAIVAPTVPTLPAAACCCF